MTLAARAKPQERTSETPPSPAGLPKAQRSRRVIFINRFFFPDFSATSQMLSDLVRALSDERFELHVICSRQLYGDARARLPMTARFAGAHVHRCWSTDFGRDRLLGRAVDYLSFAFSSALSLLRLARRGSIIVAMTDPPLISVGAALIARLRRAYLINWLQDVFPEVAIALGVVPLPPVLIKLLIAVRNWSLRVAEKNIVLGIGMHRRVSRMMLTGSRQQMIENWADAEALSPRPVQWSELRRSLGPEVRFVVQYSGNMGRAHDYRTLLGAALELNHEAGWLFLLIGGGSSMHALRREAELLQLSNMRFLPYQPRANLADSLAAADVHVSCLQPNLEGLIVPSKLYGILAAGRPVIVIGDLDGEQARVLRSENCGGVIACGDSPRLVDELRRMRAEPEWMRDAGLRARALFERRYTLTGAVRKWRKVLERMAD